VARPQLHFQLNLSPRQRLAAKIAGYTLLSFFTFLFTLHLVFPYQRLKGKLIETLSAKYDVSIASAGRGLFPGEAVFKKIVLRSRPSKPDEKPTELVIDRLELDVGLDFNLIGALRRKAVVDFEAELGAGEIEGELELSKSMVEVRVSTDALPLETVPGLDSAIGLPMTGGLHADVEIRLPGAKWQNAEGRIAFECKGCTVGDGVAKLTLNPRKQRRRTPGWDSEARSITVPRLALGKAGARIDISKGIGEISNFAAGSDDGWLKITGKIEFKDPFASSLFPGCMQFKLSDELKQREPKFGNIEYGISEKLRQGDGSYSIPTTGKLTELRWNPKQRCGGGATDDEDDGAGMAARPVLTPELPAGGTAVDPSEVPGVAGAEAGAVEPPPVGAPGLEAAAATEAPVPPDPDHPEENGDRDRERERYRDEDRDRDGDRDDVDRDEPVDEDPEDRRRRGDGDESDEQGGVD
jgi:type II secretion system protein N